MGNSTVIIITLLCSTGRVVRNSSRDEYMYVKELTIIVHKHTEQIVCKLHTNSLLKTTLQSAASTLLVSTQNNTHCYTCAWSCAYHTI